MFKLKGVVQPYAWGGSDFIPALTGIPSTGSPAAEYWLGAHPAASAEVLDSQGKVQGSLYEMIREKPQYFLGEKLSQQYDSLPFLVKVLDVKQMLSIQVHPDKYGAEQGFDKENEAGIPLTAANRNYKDRNAKREVMFALSDFWLLKGFRKADKMSEFFSIPEFSFLQDHYNKGGYELLYTTIMRMEQSMVNEILKPLAERVTILYNNNELTKKDPDFWAARALQTYFVNGNIDRGIFSIYLLNLIQLSKGQRVDQWPGVLHAYLEGQNVEVMSNSDNVVRAGLTNKHIDIEELLSIVSYEGVPVDIPQHAGNTLYSSLDFQVFHCRHFSPYPFEAEGPVIILVISGSVTLQAGAETASLHPGESIFVVPGPDLHISCSEHVEFFTVTVPKKES